MATWMTCVNGMRRHLTTPAGTVPSWLLTTGFGFAACSRAATGINPSSHTTPRSTSRAPDHRYIAINATIELPEMNPRAAARHPPDAIRDCVVDGVIEEDDAGAGAVATWSTAHGLASLYLDGQLDRRTHQLGNTIDTIIPKVARLLESALRG